MNSSRKVTAVAFAIALGSIAAGSVAFTAQPAFAADSEHSSSVGEAVSDTWITTKVKSELLTTKGIPSTDISVETNNGVVTLTGVLSSDIEVKKAVAAAKSVKGVKEVDDSGLKVK